MSPIVETPASGPERLQLTFDVEAPPSAVWRSFTDSTALEAWWPEVAEVDPVVGGAIIARWPSMTWTMRGRFTELRPGEIVEFTWSWDHEPDTPDRVVRVEMADIADPDHDTGAADASTRVVVTHGDYGADDTAERSDHLAGWLHFLPRLRESLRTPE